MEKLLTEHNLIIEVEKLKKIIKDKVEQRFLEFKKLGEEGDELDLYSELCFVF